MKRSLLHLMGFIYLSLPSAIFCLCWYDWWLSVPVVGVMAYMIYVFIKNTDGNVKLGSMRFEVVLLLIITLWVLVCGVGGFMWQNRWDHFYRNAVFRELVFSSWPMIQGGEEVCYYFGYWLPAALLAKGLRSLEVGYVFQVVWAVWGIWLTFRMLFDKLNGIKWRYVVVFVLFGGLDILGVIFLWKFPLSHNLHIELWNALAFFESNTTMLCWVYNQVIPAWVGCMLIFSTSISRGWPFVLAVMMISCPFPVVGLLPLVVFYVLQDSGIGRNVNMGIKNIFSLRNIAALIIGILTAVFMSRTDSLKLAHFDDVASLVWHFVLLFVLEIGFLYPFVRKYVSIRDAAIMCGTLVVLVLLPVSKQDLVSRAFIPLSVFLMVGCCHFLKNIDSQSLGKRVMFYIVSVLVSITAFLEMSRGIYMTIREPKENWRNEQLNSIYEESACRANFIVPVSER